MLVWDLCQVLRNSFYIYITLYHLFLFVKFCVYIFILTPNAIQNANDLSKVNKHNLRDYDKNKELIRVIDGSDNIINDVKDLYLKELEESKI